MENNNKEDLQTTASKSNDTTSSTTATTTTPTKVAVAPVVKQKNHTFFKLIALLSLGVAGATAYQVFVPDTMKHNLWKQYFPSQQGGNYVTQEEFAQYVQATDAKLVALTASVEQINGRPTLKVDWSALEATEQGTAQHLNQILEDFAKNLEAYLDQKVETALANLPAQTTPADATSTQGDKATEEATQQTAAQAQESATAPEGQTDTEVTQGDATSQAEGTNPTAQVATDAEKAQLLELMKQLITTPEFSQYFRDLATQPVKTTETADVTGQGTQGQTSQGQASQGQDTQTTAGQTTQENQLAPVNANNLTVTVSQLANLSNETKTQVSNLEAQVKALSEQTQSQLTLTDAKAASALTTATELQQKLANRLEDAVAKAGNLLVQQSLTEAQTLVTNGASLDAIKLRLQLAAALTDNETLRAAVAQDLASLTASANTDNEALATNVSYLVMQVDNLPAIKPNLGVETAVAVQQDQGFFTTVGNLLSKYISVNKVTDSALADKNANIFVHENLKLSLQTALLAAQTGKQNIFTNSVQLASTNLNSYFDDQDATVAAFKQAVAQLTVANFSYNPEYKLTSLALFAGVTPASDAQPLQGNPAGDVVGPQPTTEPNVQSEAPATQPTTPEQPTEQTTPKSE